MFRKGYRPEAVRLAEGSEGEDRRAARRPQAGGHARRAPRARPRRLTAAVPVVRHRRGRGRAGRPRPTASRPDRACRPRSGGRRRRRGRRGRLEQAELEPRLRVLRLQPHGRTPVRRRRGVEVRRALRHAGAREERLERERVERAGAVGCVRSRGESPRSSAALTSRTLRSASHGGPTDATAASASATAAAAAKALRDAAPGRPAAARTPTAKSAGPVTATKSHGKSTSACRSQSAGATASAAAASRSAPVSRRSAPTAAAAAAATSASEERQADGPGAREELERDAVRLRLDRRVAIPLARDLEGVRAGPAERLRREDVERLAPPLEPVVRARVDEPGRVVRAPLARNRPRPRPHRRRPRSRPTSTPGRPRPAEHAGRRAPARPARADAARARGRRQRRARPRR